ncbi:MAG: DUF433 domain-containing protein [Phycisphaeraceae bacterium]|nr:DUF433 domain-containing protein [Phycisphaeraceae bacterium]MBX3406724.1 DUF433 domain-containing protein [Phycisphaeraceae bacterium]
MNASAEKLLSRITQTPGQCGGRPCIRGMRIRVVDILEMLSEGVEVSEILSDFPDLEADDIRACLVFAARRVSHMQIAA